MEFVIAADQDITNVGSGGDQTHPRTMSSGTADTVSEKLREKSYHSATVSSKYVDRYIAFFSKKAHPLVKMYTLHTFQIDEST